MFERIRERTQELKNYYALPEGNPLHAYTENGLKLLGMKEEENPDYSGQGGLMWSVFYFKVVGPVVTYGPMDSRELREMHPELYWNVAIDWTVHGIDIPEGP